MKIALVMPPMDSGARSRSAFRTLHELSKGKPHWTPLGRRLGGRCRASVDFEDFPKGLILLGTMIDARHELRIFNFINDHQSSDEVMTFAPDVVGVSCSTGSSLIWVDQFTRTMKSRQGSTVLLGGPHVTLDPHGSLTTTVADFVLLGEADLVIDPVLDHIDGRARLPEAGVGTYVSGEPVIGPAAIVHDLSILPQPRNDLVDLERYLSIGVESSRGCDRACEFCFLSGFSPRCRWRPRPVEAVVAELAALSSRVDLRRKKLYFLDLSFSHDRQHAIDLCDALVRAGIDGEKWTCTDMGLDEEMVGRLLAAGFSHVYVGVESGSARFIDRYGKTRSKENVLRFFAMTKRLGLVPQGDLVLMAPGETDQSLEETWELCKAIYRIPAVHPRDRSRASFVVHLFKLFPGTRAAQALARNGVTLPGTLRQWGELYERLASGDYSALGAEVGVSRGRLVWTLLRFAALNGVGYVIPRLVDRLSQRLSRTLPALARAHPRDGLPQLARKALLDGWLGLRRRGWREERCVRRLRRDGPVRLAVFDLDGTLVEHRNVWALVTEHFPGQARTARRLHRRYLRGELGYDELCRAVVALWRPAPSSAFFEVLGARLVLRDGAEELVRACRAAGAELAIVSTGLHPLAAHVGRRLGIDRVFANRLRFGEDGVLLGVERPLAPTDKAVVLERLAAELGVAPAQTMYVGDSRDDLPAVRWSGIGVFFDNVNRHKAEADLVISSLRELLPVVCSG